MCHFVFLTHFGAWCFDSCACIICVHEIYRQKIKYWMWKYVKDIYTSHFHLGQCVNPS